MADDEAYDILAWHGNAPVLIDEAAEKKKEKAKRKAEAELNKKKAKEEKKARAEEKEKIKEEKKARSEGKEAKEAAKEAAAKKLRDKEKKKKQKAKKAAAAADAEGGDDTEQGSDDDNDDVDQEDNNKDAKKKSKKSKKDQDEKEEGEVVAPVTEGEEEVEALSKRQKRKKEKEALAAASAKAEGKPVKEKKEGSRKGEYGVWIGNLSFLTTEKSLRHLFRNVGSDITRVNLPLGGGYNKKGNKGFAYVDFATSEAMEKAIELSESDLDGRKVLIKSSKSYEGRPALSKSAIQEKSIKQKHQVSPTLFVGNLSFQSTREGLQALFGDVGEIRKVRLATFEDSGKCKGFAYIDYMNPESATTALLDPKKHFLDGRQLKLEYASAEATLKGNPREFRKRKRELEEAEATAANGGVPVPKPEEQAAMDEEEARIQFNAEQKAKRQRRQPGEGSAKKLQGHQRPGFALANAQRATQGIVEFKGNKVTF